MGTDSEHDAWRGAVGRALADAGFAAAPRLTPLRGGRTNALWTFQSGGQAYVAKLYVGTGTPLFRNDPVAEAAVLRSLAGRGLAPEWIRDGVCDAGPFLVYRHIPASRDAVSVEDCARLLRAVHASAPLACLPSASCAPDAVRAAVTQMISELGGARRQQLIEVAPAPAATPPLETTALALLHGDPVPANFVGSGAGARLVDWQCPAIGDPCADIAIYLSPAMRALYGGARLGPGDLATFWAAYGGAQVQARYVQLAPLLHWRIAAHCAWRASRGDADYADAARIELAHLAAL